MFNKKKTNQEEKEVTQGSTPAEPALRDEALTPDDNQDLPDRESDNSEQESDNSEQSEQCDDSNNSDNSDNSDNSEKSPRGFREEIERAYCLGAGIDDATFARVKEVLEKIAECVYGDKFNPESIQMVMKAMNYDTDLTKAREEGIAAGRSEAIAETFRNRRSAAEKAAEIPHFKGSKGIGSRLQGDSIFEVARGAKQ